MTTASSTTEGCKLHIVTLACRDSEHATRCLAALATEGRRDALAFNCISYEFGLAEGRSDTIYLIERWNRWEDLDSLLRTKVVPALPMYNRLLKRPFDPDTDTVRVTLSNPCPDLVRGHVSSEQSGDGADSNARQ